MDARLSDDGPLKGDTSNFIGFLTVSACMASLGFAVQTACFSNSHKVFRYE